MLGRPGHLGRLLIGSNEGKMSVLGGPCSHVIAIAPQVCRHQRFSTARMQNYHSVTARESEPSILSLSDRMDPSRVTWLQERVRERIRRRDQETDMSIGITPSTMIPQGPATQHNLARIKEIQTTRTTPSSPAAFLRDTFGRQHDYLRISLTEKCNLRCRYCMPAEGIATSPDSNLLTKDEIVRLATLFVDAGVQKIRLTGGEPTLRKDLAEIVGCLGKLKSRGLKQLGVTTNGLTLRRNVDELVNAGLTHFNISLDTLNPASFELMTRRPAAGLKKVLESIDRAASLPGTVVKVNVVVMRGFNDKDDVLRFIEWSRTRKVVVRFIEYMPFDGNEWSKNRLVPYKTLLKDIDAHFGSTEKVADGPNDTTKHYRLPDAVGSFGFITSMTEHFCGTCNRLRITADGQIKNCLFDGAGEISLRDALRASPTDRADDNAELVRLISASVRNKSRKHGGIGSVDALANNPNRSMIRIGG